jgi:hypothetical protein
MHKNIIVAVNVACDGINQLHSGRTVKVTDEFQVEVVAVAVSENLKIGRHGRLLFILLFLTPSDYSDSRPLLPNVVLDLDGLFLNFPVNVFGLAFGFQVAIAGYDPGSLLELTFDLVHLAFGLVSFARFHGFASPV